MRRSYRYSQVREFHDHVGQAGLTFLGMIAGLIIKLTEGTFIQSTVSFNEGFFFNLLLPPIILASGYELHQVSLSTSTVGISFSL